MIIKKPFYRNFNRYFFFVASLLNSIGFIVSNESHVYLNLKTSKISIEYINLSHHEIVEGSTNNFIKILERNEVQSNAVLALTNINTKIIQKGVHSAIRIEAIIQDTSLLLDRLGFFYQNEKIVYKLASGERVIDTNGLQLEDLIVFDNELINLHLNRINSKELNEEWIQMMGKSMPLNDILTR